MKVLYLGAKVTKKWLLLIQTEMWPPSDEPRVQFELHRLLLVVAVMLTGEAG